MHEQRPRESGSTQTDGFDFDRLEHGIEQLLEAHARLRAERDALLQELADREHRLSQANAKLDAERARRGEALDRIDRILARLGRLESTMPESQDDSVSSAASGAVR